MSTKFIDLFAGIGGIRLAFENAASKINKNVKCVFTSEWDKFAQATYEANYGEVPNGDITQIHEKDIPKHDLLVAGFPCQAFSQAGLKKGFEDARGTMFFEIARILDHHKPKAFLLENVKGLRGHDKGNTFKTIMSILNELGYKTLAHKVLNAKEFGLPQNRERIFVVGFRKKTSFIFPEPIELKTTMQDFLEDDTNSKFYLGDKGVKFVTNEKNIKKRFTQINGEIALCQKRNQQSNWHGDFIFEGAEEFQDYDEFIFDVKKVEDKYYLSNKVSSYVLNTGTKNFHVKPDTDLPVARALLSTMHKMHRAGVDNYITYKKDKSSKGDMCPFSISSSVC